MRGRSIREVYAWAQSASALNTLCDRRGSRQGRPNLFGLAQLVALDLSGRSPRQVLDEFDHVRVLVAAKVALAPGAQLVGEGVRVRWRARGADHACLDPADVVDVDTDHRGLRHPRRAEETALDIGRRHPQAANLD